MRVGHTCIVEVNLGSIFFFTKIRANQISAVQNSRHFFSL